MNTLISVIIPNYNGAATIQQCLQAVFACVYDNFEVIVVDDCSDDSSRELIRCFPCQLISLTRHQGAARARNIGAAHSRGEVLFFTDADCCVGRDTLRLARQVLMTQTDKTIIGGSYTALPRDHDFFSIFQSIFIRYSETKHLASPDYIATHAMAIGSKQFFQHGGFAEGFLPILEDVEFSHRLRSAGFRLLMDPAIQVQHIFRFSLYRSMRNALIKSMYWTFYSFKHRDLFSDSGTASIELKTNVAAFLLSLLLAAIATLTARTELLWFIPVLAATNGFVSRGLFAALYRAKGLLYTLAASLYYLFVYPLAVATGVIAAITTYYRFAEKWE